MAAERDSVTLLHLSDTQFGRHHRFGNWQTADEDLQFDTLYKRLELDLEGLRTDYGVKPDAVVVTGDLAEWGRKSEFDDVYLLLDGLCNYLKIPRERVAIVPGNHDINRKLCEAYFAQCEGNEKKPKPPFWPKWELYANLYKQFYGTPFTEAQPWSLWEMPELRLVVAGLNSTMAESHLDNTHYGQVGENQLRWFERELARYPREDWAVLGLVHHNVIRGDTDDDENLRDAGDLRQILGGSLDLLLHGHTHNAKWDRLGDLLVVSTGSAALERAQRPAEVPNQYQCLRLTATGVERWTRGYDMGRKEWIGDNRSSEKGDTWITKKDLRFSAYGQAWTPKKAHDPSRYLHAMREATCYFEVQGLVVGENKAYKFPMDEFYLPLTTTGAADGVGDRGRSIPLEEALDAHRTLLLVGDPGAGKSTFLKRVAFHLSRDWREGAPLPVRIEAAALANFVGQRYPKTGPAEDTSPEWIPLFLENHCEENNLCELGAEYFREKLQAGGCQVLIDGLDETPDRTSRKWMAKLIGKSAAAYAGCRFVVTSRPEGKVLISGFEERSIGDLEPEAICEFLAKLAKLLYPADGTAERKFREELLSSVNGRREIRKMARNPVMLTALAVLQHNNVKLPEKRVDLYASIVKWLSEKRDRAAGRKSPDECLMRLRTLALAMQLDSEGRRKQAPLAWAGDRLRGRFGTKDEVERFLVAEESDSGIVVSRGEDIAFWHLTFQEYLAALEIAGLEDADQHALLLGDDAKIYRPEWRETVLLYGGLLYKAGPAKVNAFLRNVLDGMGERPTLARRAQCVGFIGALLQDLAGYEVADLRYAESLRLVMDIFDGEKSRSVPFDDRLAAAEALGQAGDSRLAKQEWVEIPASENYWIGAQSEDKHGRHYDKEAYEDETPRVVDLAAFRIGKYPVTVAEYQRFVEDGNAPNRVPEKWEVQLEYPNWPVVHVTWHQAAAYCKWAGGRLPTEEEWERAARGPNCTKYPWGNADINPSRANYSESNLHRPTPVGLYPSGASAEGACDMIGNVWEWTSSEWEKGSGTYVWRGGAFGNNRRDARSSCRLFGQPVVQSLTLGFRLAGGIP
ncbi:MAG: SUMF1/EgtB/PvdO family nonheme iron enzyme [Bryobacterales bacterium]|nr:SUMF1/EgtB/PvdO family nonheme iron enzyme [Bryobacterales bacterium]